MDNSLQAYLPVLIQVVIGLALPAIILAASHLLGQRPRANTARDSAYECGIQPSADARTHPRFAVGFYVAAMLFILFEIEVVLLLPGTLVFRELAAQNAAIIFPVIFFLGASVLGLVYEIRKGAIEWQK